MHVAIITESFPPDVNGVANSVVRVAAHLRRRGHHPLVIAPTPASGRRDVAGPHPYPVVRVRSVPVPRYRSFRLGLPTAALADALTAHAPDVVHLARTGSDCAGTARRRGHRSPSAPGRRSATS